MTNELVPVTRQEVRAADTGLTALVEQAGGAVSFAWDEFVVGQVRTDRAMSAGDMSRVVKRRLKDPGLPPRLSPHSFRVTAIADLLSQGVPLEDVQQLAGHADPRTTRVYDRRGRKITRYVVERISV